ncbi:unnamed protein product [Meloidogyne enterolobii]|uniref:Uncharacterized protein n=1 Tax=Meloidogyne enterolobii TaxID=390850 RepID=A0ACB0XZV5_MELEN
MKLDSILIILIVNAFFWSLINSVKNNKSRHELSRVGEISKYKDGAELSAAPKIQKDETLKPIPKIAKKVTTNHNEEKGQDYYRNYYQNNKEKIQERKRIYYKNNKEKLKKCSQKYRENNKEKRLENDQKYYQNNREKLKESVQKYCQKNKEILKENKREYRENNKEKI